MADVLLILGLICLAAAGFLISVVVGLVVVGVGLVLCSLALLDGKGSPWRS
jgi:hypothetical protein